MNREDIIRMAVDAGIIPWTKHEYVGGKNFSASDEGLDGDLASLIQFAALVASAERESLRESFRVVTAAEASAAILHERKACADLCDRFANRMMSAEECADAIRARGQA